MSVEDLIPLSRLEQIISLNIPVFLGWKPCAVITLAKEISGELTETLKRIHQNSSRVQLRVLFEGEKTDTILLWHEDALRTLLRKKAVKSFLEEQSFYDPAFSPEDCLKYLSLRFYLYKTGVLPFPDEIGIFLGYPLSDVRAYVVNQGNHSLFCGLWKVYSDPVSAKLCMSRYQNACRSFALTLHRSTNLCALLRHILKTPYQPEEFTNCTKCFSVQEEQ